MYVIILTMAVMMSGFHPAEVSSIEVRLRFESNSQCAAFYQKQKNNMPAGMALKKGVKICGRE